MSRSQSVLTVLAATLALAAVAYLAPPKSPGTANAAEAVAQAAESAAWLPEGLELKTPEIAYGVDGALRDLNASVSKDLLPSDNAAVLLVQVFGEDVFESVLRGASTDMLGIRRLADAPRFQYIAAYVMSHRAPDIDARVQADQIEEALAIGIEQPWTRDEYPHLAEFLDANSAAIDLVAAAADRPGYYAPLLSIEEPMRLMSASYAIEFRMPYMARCLTARGLNRLSEGDASGGTADLLACHKLAALLGKGSPLDISCAKAHIVDSFASHAEVALLNSGKLQPDQAAVLLAALKDAPEMPTSEDAADRGERAIIHQELELLRTDEESRKGYLEEGSPEDLVQLEKIVNDDSLFKLAVAAADAQQDKMVRALAIRPHEEQYAEFAKLDEEHATWLAGDEGTDVSFAELAAQDPEEAARSIGVAMAMSLRTNAWQRRHTDDRSRLRRDSVLVSLALVVYRGTHDGYPAELSELAPELLPEVPIDVFSGTAFDYSRQSPDHVVIKSLGANKSDDAGMRYNDDLIIELQ